MKLISVMKRDIIQTTCKRLTTMNKIFRSAGFKCHNMYRGIHKGPLLSCLSLTEFKCSEQMYSNAFDWKSFVGKEITEKSCVRQPPSYLEGLLTKQRELSFF